MLNSSERQEALVRLKQTIREHSPFHGGKALSFSALEQGVPAGAVSEFFGRQGDGVTEAVLSLLREHADKKVAWIEPALATFPTGLLQRGVHAEQVLFVESRNDLVWTALECLQSQLFGIVVLSRFDGDEKDFRRLQMAAERSSSTVILLSHSEAPLSSWAISLQVHVSRVPHTTEPGTSRAVYQILEKPNLNLTVQKRRHAVA